MDNIAHAISLNQLFMDIMHVYKHIYIATLDNE